MKKIALLALISSAALLACSGDDNNTNDAGNDVNAKDQSTNDVQQNNDASDSGGNPAPPTLGTQIDRMGRPTINTALNHVFDSTSAAGTAKDAYNADKNVAGWTTYAPEFAKNLGIFDALDMMCGNQLAFAKANSYATLAGVASDDRLYIDTSAATCTTYLAVEAKALGISNADCGGRTLKYDVIDITYSALAAGVFSGVTDGVSADANKTGGTTFPYLIAAQ